MLAIRRTRTPSRRLIPACSATVLLACLALPSASLGQAVRTWVSGLGDDANPCSRTAPCKTFPGAYSRTAVGGEIDVLDPGGFGTINIGHSITISGRYTQASILGAGTTGITINAGSNDRVVIDHIAIDGVNRYSQPGINGVKINSVGTVRLQDVHIFGFGQNGVDFESNSLSPAPQSRLVIDHSVIDGNTLSGLLAVPQTAVGEKTTITNTSLDDNGCGVSNNGPCDGSSVTSTNPSMVSVANSSLSNNLSSAGASGAGVQSLGSGSILIIGRDTIMSNTIGLNHQAGGQIFSFHDNELGGNTTDGTSTSPATPGARDVAKAWKKIQARAKAQAEKYYDRQ